MYLPVPVETLPSTGGGITEYRWRHYRVPVETLPSQYRYLLGLVLLLRKMVQCCHTQNEHYYHGLSEDP